MNENNTIDLCKLSKCDKQEKINNLQSKIDKAIEFCDYSFKNPWYVSEKELLGKIIDILKEVE